MGSLTPCLIILHAGLGPAGSPGGVITNINCYYAHFVRHTVPSCQPITAICFLFLFCFLSTQILGILASVDGMLDSENNKKGKHVSDYLDLDLATFSANKTCSKRMKDTESNKFLSITQESDTNVIVPRILSRGDRLPSEIMTVSSSVENSKISGQDIKYPDEIENEKEKINVITNQNSNIHCLDQEAAVIYLVHHCLVHLGDIARLVYMSCFLIVLFQ